MGRDTGACPFEINEFLAEMDAAWRKRLEERLLQFSAVKTHRRNIREMGAKTREGEAFGSVAHGGFYDRASIHHLLHQAQMLQHTNRICGKPDAGPDFFQFVGAFEDLDSHACLPQSNGSREAPYTGADDEYFWLWTQETLSPRDVSVAFHAGGRETVHDTKDTATRFPLTSNRASQNSA